MFEDESESAPFQSMEEFYQSNAKAEDIRNACIPILQKLHQLLYNEEVAKDKGEQARLYSQLELDNGKLIDLGVSSKMKMDRSLKEYQSNPLTVAEFFAGQLIPLTGTQIPSEKEAVALMEEFSQSRDNDTFLAESSELPQKLREFITKRNRFRFIQWGFAIDNQTINPQQNSE